MKPIPLAILSDAPDCPSGFGRITRDLAWHLYRHVPQVRVATFGYWGRGSRAFPWPQYAMGDFRADANISDLPLVWRDFAGDQPGILLTIYDAARLLLLSNPELIEEETAAQKALKSFLQTKPFKLWGYFPIDSHGPREKLTSVLHKAISPFDRILAYGPYGSRILRNTLGVDIPWLPHGLYASTFRPTPGGRALLPKLAADDLLLGVVATNQPRKDWGTVFEVLDMLGPQWKLWAHVDKTIADAWSFPALADAFGVGDRVMVTQGLDDATMAQLYSACAATFAPGLGEGFGFPILESLFCGANVVHVDYAGGADLIPDKDCLVTPHCLRLDSVFSVYRPVLSTRVVAEAIVYAALRHATHPPLEYDWPKLWPKWKKWIQEGL